MHHTASPAAIQNTVTRWSSAKGIRYIATYLPASLCQEICTHILDLFSENVIVTLDGDQDLNETSEATWHGACLALAEMIRKGLVAPSIFPQMIPWCIQVGGEAADHNY